MKRVAAIAFGLTAVAATAAGVADPYIWLEQVSSPRALAWVNTENARTTGILEKDPRFETFRTQALAIAEAEDKIPAPKLVDGRIANFWQDAGHVRGLWRMTDMAGYRRAAPPWTTLIDLDALSAAEKANWVWKSADCESPSGTRCLVALSDGGEDAETVREYDVAARRFVDGGFVLPRSKQTAAWEGDDALIVARDWGAGTMTTSGYPFVAKRVMRGRPLASATEIFRGKPSDLGLSPFAYADGQGHRIAGIQRTIGFFSAEMHLLGPNGLVRVPLPADFKPAGLVDGQLVVLLQSPWTIAGRTIAAGTLVSFDAAAAAAGRPLAPETLFVPGPRQSVDGDNLGVTKDGVVATIYDNVRGRGMVFARTGGRWAAHTLALPETVSVDLVDAQPESGTAFVRVTGFLDPDTLWAVDAAGDAARVKSLPARFDATGLVTEQFEATSTDGTKIPYFVVHRRDAKADGATPTILTAYGGFQVSNTPYYSGSIGKLWLERGGAYVLANIRGGGEFGPAWHDAALKTKRQVAYDDFAAVGRDLVARKITSPARLGIQGGSNGGLLMGVELVQHPELWNAVEIDVPLLDMIRYERIAAGASWVGEYGSIADPAARAFWEKTSPYQNLKRGVRYPVPYIFTTTKDDRVGPVHARKFAARMKEYGLPYLYYENTEGGHGAGANLRQMARTRALAMVYFAQRLMDGGPSADK